MVEIEKDNKLLMLCSLASLAIVFGGVDIEKINLGFITVKSLGELLKFGLVFFLSYLLWGYYQNWQKYIGELFENDLETYLCMFLTDVLVQRIKVQGPSFCEMNQTFTQLNDWSNISAESSWFIYAPHSGKKSKNRTLRVQLQNTDGYNNTSDINHVVHSFYEDELSELKRDYWVKWFIVHSFFRLSILPAVLGFVSWVTMVLYLTIG